MVGLLKTYGVIMTTGMKLKQFLLHEKRAGVDLPYDLIELIHEVSIT